MRNLINSISEVIERHCPNCNDVLEQEQCTSCSELINFKPQGCARCGCPMSFIGSSSCQDCLSLSPSLSEVHSFHYNLPPLSGLLRKWKRSGDPIFASLVKNLVSKHDAWMPFPNEHLLALPRHWLKQRIRPDNLPYELANMLSDLHSRPILSPQQVGLKKRWTKGKKHLSRRGRLVNTKNPFTSKKAALSEYPPICLIDDVMTTGSTLSEAADCLAALGFQEIRAWVLVRGYPIPV